MGIMADSMLAFAQPLLDETDGSPEEMQRGLNIAMLCWNLALMSEEEQVDSLLRMQPSLGMSDEEFLAFSSSVVEPMIQRHREMFPRMHNKGARVSAPQPQLRQVNYPGTGRNDPCPCGSAKKYKKCCGQ